MTAGLSVLSGNAFVISDEAGDIDAAQSGDAAAVDAAPYSPRGFFWEDTRFVSRFELRVDGRVPRALGAAHLDTFAAQIFAVAADHERAAPSALSIVRRRLVGGEWLEEIELLNHSGQTQHVVVTIAIDADFADVLEVANGQTREREIVRRADERALSFLYRRGDYARETRVTCPDGGSFDEAGVRLEVELAPHSTARRRVVVAPGAEQPGRRQLALRTRSFTDTRRELTGDLHAWLSSAPTLFTDWDELRETYRRSLIDLSALLFSPEGADGASLPAAGLPSDMALIGRDSLLTSYQALPFYPDLAATTLRVLASHQGQREATFNGEQPGKILHELRVGECAAFGEHPLSPSYGSADATPLWLIVLDEYVAWTGDESLAQALEPNARAALEWIDAWGDRDGDGYLEYEHRDSSDSFKHEGWKDSADAIGFSDGTPAVPPLATCEIQGYVYDAKVRTARLAEAVWDDRALAARLRAEAEALRVRFERDFWLEERGFYALALDADKRPVDSLSSNIGHLLWSGIVSTERAERLAAHLLGPELFSGWGIRTLATSEAGFSPLAPHRGAVWPHDNALIAEGLSSYGFGSHAGRIAVALIHAAAYFGHRLPEMFAGYARESTHFPVAHPSASRPRATATAAPLLCLRALLGLEPEQAGATTDPNLPEFVRWLTLDGVHGPAGRVDVHIGPRPDRESPRVPRQSTRPSRWMAS